MHKNDIFQQIQHNGSKTVKFLSKHRYIYVAFEGLQCGMSYRIYLEVRSKYENQALLCL